MIGVIGCGKQGEKHLAALRALGVAEPRCTDTDAERARSIAERFGAHATTLDDLFADPEIGAIVVATPTVTHHPLVARGLATGKPVLCEKPLAASLAEAERIADLARASDSFVMTGFIYRFAPAFVWARQLIRPEKEESPLGAPAHAVLRIGGRGNHESWKHAKATDGGVVNEMMVHLFDLAIWLFGPLDRVVTVESSVLRPERCIGGTKVAVDADDYVVISARAANGAPVLMIGDLLTPAFTQYVDAQFANGSFFGSIQRELPTRVFLKEARGGLPAGTTPHDASGDELFVRQMAAFLDGVRTGRTPMEGRIDDAIAVMRIVEAVNRPGTVTRETAS